MLKDFYVSFSAVCFTLLGLWLIVVQTRHAEWRGSLVHRRRVYGVAMHFSLPGLMSVLALVDPESSALWRTSFAVAAIGGAVALIALRGAAPGKLGLTAYITAIALYVLIGILAIAPHIVGGLGFQAAPVRVEAALLAILVFAGVNVAWLLLFEETPSDYGSPGRTDQLARRDGAGHALAWHDIPNGGYSRGHAGTRVRSATSSPAAAMLGLPPLAGHPSGPATGSSMQAIRTSSTYRPPRKYSSRNTPSAVKPHDS